MNFVNFELNFTRQDYPTNFVNFELNLAIFEGYGLHFGGFRFHQSNYLFYLTGLIDSTNLTCFDINI